MTDLDAVDWPPEPIRTERLVLRAPRAGDRAGLFELLTSPVAGAYLGGPRSPDDVERILEAPPGKRPGSFAVESDGAFLGAVSLARRDADRPGHLRPEGGELEVGYMFLPAAWGHGYATEAVRALLGWAADAFGDEPVVLCTQVANDRSVRLAGRLGFVEVDRFTEYDAEQWFGVRR